ncbi:MAG: DUF1559 domain-containing protein [Planctomycetota bacterium]|jgi:prepilin-type N-terminal cleavage/methylation domain-containing protein/prepilin-type processing-associated H-X9-DG protein
MKRSRKWAALDRRGFTLVELLVVIAIIGVLVGLLLPAVQAAREAARRMSCSNNLKQQGLALHNYESTFKRFPAHMTGNGDLGSNGSVGRTQRGQYAGWFSMLPYLEQATLYSELETNPMQPGFTNATGLQLLVSTRLPFLECPSDAGDRDPEQPNRTNTLSSYAFCTGDNYSSSQVVPGERNNTALRVQKLPINNRGIFGRYNYLRLSAITDGLSNTLALGERQRPFERKNVGFVIALTGDPTTLQPIVCKATLIGRSYIDPTLVPNSDAGVGYRGFSGLCYHAAFTTILPPNSASCLIGESGISYHVTGGIWTPGSEHGGGAQFTLADGSVRFINESIDTGNLATVAPARDGVGPSPYGVWGALGTRMGSETVPVPE